MGDMTVGRTSMPQSSPAATETKITGKAKNLTFTIKSAPLPVNMTGRVEAYAKKKGGVKELLSSKTFTAKKGSSIVFKIVTEEDGPSEAGDTLDDESKAGDDEREGDSVKKITKTQS